MRILIAVHGHPPTHHGGAERRAARTARNLAARGHQVCVLCVESASSGAAALRWEDTEEAGILIRRIFFDLSRSPDPFRAGYDNPQIAHAVTALIDSWHPDLLHLFSGYLLSASTVRAATDSNLPVVVSLTDYWWLCHRITLVRSDGTRCDGPSAAGCARCQAEQSRRFRLPARLWPRGADAVWDLAGRSPALGKRLDFPEQIDRAATLRAVLGTASALIAPSQYLADAYLRQGVAPERIHVQRQGVALDRCPTRLTSSELRVGYIGQVKHHKGVHLLLSAWSRLHGPRPRRLVVYGSDAGEETYGRQLRATLQHLDDATWEGAFQGAEVWQVLANLDVLVVPSRWAENSPNSILEAQAVGVPIVGTDLGGVAELVEHGRNGLVFAPDDDADLARQLQRLLDEPALLDRLRQQPIPFRTVDDEIDDLLAVYDELIRPPTTVTASGPTPRRALPTAVAT